MPFIEFNRSKIYYEVHGKGEPLLFFHGWNGSIESFKYNLLKKLEGNFKIILIDLPGYGNSEKIILSFDNLSSLTNHFLKYLEIDRINLAGYCMGSIFALDYAIRNPEKVSKIMLIESYIDIPFFVYPLLIGKIKKPLFNFFLFSQPGSLLTKKYLYLPGFKYRDRFFEGFKRAIPETSLNYIEMLYNYSKADHSPRFHSIGIPVSIITGEKTHSSIVKSALKLQKNIKNSSMIYLENSAHFPIEENSAKLAEIIKEFF